MLAWLQPKVAEEAAGDALGVVIKDGVLGALLIIAVGLCVWAVMRLNSVQNKRVEDQRLMNERMEKSQDRMAGLIEKMTEAFTGHKAALDRLSESEKSQTETMVKLCSKMEGMQGTVDSVIRDAVRGRRSYTPSSMRPPTKGE